MARLRVGEIEIDGANVTIGGRRATSAPYGPKTPSRPSEADLDSFLTRVRISGSAMLVVGATMAVAGGAWYVLAGPASLVTYLVEGGLLCSTGLGVMVLGFLKRASTRRLVAADAKVSDLQIREDSARIEELLLTAPAESTVEWICKRLAIGEARTVKALVAMRASQRIEEDLDLETGEWRYSLRREESRIEATRNLDDRFKQIERRNDK